MAKSRFDFRPTRRELVGLGAGLALANLGAWNAFAGERDRKRVLRVAHLTDIHVQPELRAADGMAACLQHVQTHKEKPDLILFGGDCVMDAFGQTRDRTKVQWDVWHRVLKAECSLPWQACIGNHDVWGWGRECSQVDPGDKDYGKAWAVDALKLGKRYHSFER